MIRPMKFMKLVAILCVIAVLFSGCNKKHQEPVSDPADEIMAGVDETEETEDTTTTTAVSQLSEPYVFHQFQDSILSAKKKNADVVGWVFARNTLINYPVYQYKDNKFYLENNGGKRKDINGSIFADFRCHFNDLSQNTVIYGHNMLSGKMFGSEKKYSNREFLENNPIIEFSTSEADRQWKIFAAYFIEPTYNYIEPNPSKELFEKIVAKAREKSLFKINNVDVNDDDKILTLSTCAPRSMGDMRFVVVARLLRDGESHDLTFDEPTTATASTTASSTN